MVPRRPGGRWGALAHKPAALASFVSNKVSTRAAMVTSGGMRSGLTSLRPHHHHHHHHDTFGVVSASTVRAGCDRASLYQSRAEPFVSATAPHVIAQLRTAARLSRARLEKKN